MTLFVQAGEVQHLHGALLGLFFALCTGVAEVGGGGDVVSRTLRFFRGFMIWKVRAIFMLVYSYAFLLVMSSPL